MNILREAGGTENRIAPFVSETDLQWVVPWFELLTA